MFRFCLKAFALGVAIALACWALRMLGMPGGLAWFALVMLIWPSVILTMGDVPGLTASDMALLLGTSAVINGLLYMVIGAIGRFLYSRIGTHKSN
jgi:hypothetical protein